MRFDPRFYLLFWALELPDIAAPARDPYAAFQSDLQAALGNAKARVVTTTQDMKRTIAEADRRGARGQLAHAGPAMTANEKPIVTQDDVDAAEAVVHDLNNKLKLLPAEREAIAARRTEWSTYFEKRVDAFRLESGMRNIVFFVQVRAYFVLLSCAPVTVV